jgi:3',5'-cyclic AMP phosphodiesterase CpdA
MPRRLDFPPLSFPAILLMTATIAGVAMPAGAQERNRPEPVAVESYRATPFPDRVILTLADDPATSLAVTWRTDATAASPRAEIAVEDHGPQFEARARTVPATSVPLETSSGPARCHTAVFRGLNPKTAYLYRVGDGTHWSEWSRFRTASTRPEPFQFLYLGDAQNSIKSHWSHVVRLAFATAPDARFIIHAGDLVDRGTNDALWGEWFQAAGWINQTMPSLPSPGNHEYSKDEKAQARGEKPQLTAHWRAQFALPENGPKGLEEAAYFLDYQGVRFISLNSNERQEEQAEWLDRVLGKNPGRWAVITFHHPIYSSAHSRDNAKLRKLWQPVFDRHRVDLVLQGHDHTYARSGLMSTSTEDAGGRQPVPRAGTVYVNSVAGPKQYLLDRKPEQKRTAEGTQLFQVITIDGDRLRFEARTATGELYDAFEIRKREGLANELIERGPGTPERHVPPPAEKKRAEPLKAAAIAR